MAGETREVNLNGDDKRFWLGRLVDINDDKMNNSTSLNPEFFAERFELNDDFHFGKFREKEFRIQIYL